MANLDYATWTLLIASLGMSMISGIGVFQALFVMPEYFADPPRSLERYQRDRSFALWLPLHAATLVATVLTLIANWATGQRSLIIAATGLYGVCWLVTFVFFIPGVIAFNKVDVTGPPDRDLAARGRTWLRRSWLRHPLMFASAVALLIALARA